MQHGGFNGYLCMFTDMQMWKQSQLPVYFVSQFPTIQITALSELDLSAHNQNHLITIINTLKGNWKYYVLLKWNMRLMYTKSIRNQLSLTFDASTTQSNSKAFREEDNLISFKSTQTHQQNDEFLYK